MNIEELHERAMDIAEEAFALKRKGHDARAKEMFEEALHLERSAAQMIPRGQNSEPTRSILFRSAASLAFHVGDYEQAEQLIGDGIAGSPPLEIKNELKAFNIINILAKGN